MDTLKIALSSFQETRERKILRQNDTAFVGVLSAGLIDVGRENFGSMKRVYGIEPKIEHFGDIVDLLGRGGKLIEAGELMKEMVRKSDVVMLGALLAACKNHWNIEAAERVMKGMIVSKPRNHGVYVVFV